VYKNETEKSVIKHKTESNFFLKRIQTERKRKNKKKELRINQKKRKQASIIINNKQR